MWQLARFQLTWRIERSVGDSWASCPYIDVICKQPAINIATSIRAMPYLCYTYIHTLAKYQIHGSTDNKRPHHCCHLRNNFGSCLIYPHYFTMRRREMSPKLPCSLENLDSSPAGIHTSDGTSFCLAVFVRQWLWPTHTHGDHDTLVASVHCVNAIWPNNHTLLYKIDTSFVIKVSHAGTGWWHYCQFRYIANASFQKQWQILYIH